MMRANQIDPRVFFMKKAIQYDQAINQAKICSDTVPGYGENDLNIER